VSLTVGRATDPPEAGVPDTDRTHRATVEGRPRFCAPSSVLGTSRPGFVAPSQASATPIFKAYLDESFFGSIAEANTDGRFPDALGLGSQQQPTTTAVVPSGAKGIKPQANYRDCDLHCREVVWTPSV